MSSPALAKVQEFFGSFKDYPPRQASMEVNVDDVVQHMMRGSSR
jgi:hypothetical protein